MNSSSILVSATNDFSIRLAHAKALNLLSDRVTPIDAETLSFLINTKTTKEQEICSEFTKWCNHLSEIAENGLGIQVDIMIDETPLVIE